MLLLRDRKAALAVEHQAIADDEAGARGCEREPVDLAVVVEGLRGAGHGKRRRLASLDVSPQELAFDAEHEAPGLGIDADGAAASQPFMS